MIGANRFELNEATMIEIVQYWINNKAWNSNEPRPKVVSVKAGSSTKYENIFDISLSSAAETDK